MEFSIPALFTRAAKQNRSSVHFWQNRQRQHSFRYSTLYQEALLVAGALQQRGLKKGQRVALVLPTDPDFYRAFFGVILAGGVPSALYPPVRLGRVEEWKERTQRMLASLSSQAVLTNRLLKNILGEPVRQSAPPWGCLLVSELLQEENPGEVIPVASSDMAAIQFSSGTTGRPKAVVLSHHNILSNAAAILNCLPGKWSDHSAVSWLPLYHDMGLVGCVFTAMMADGDLTLLRPEHFVARPVSWLEALSQTRATITVAPNFAFGLCYQRIRDKELTGLDLSQWQVALCGAEAVHPNTLENFAQRFAHWGFRKEALTPVYGLAEATLAVSFSPLATPPSYQRFAHEKLQQGIAMRNEGENAVMLASVGKALADVQIEIRNCQGEKLPEGQIGEVFCAGPSVFMGYLEQPEETAKILQDGWLKTGDKGFLYQQNLYLCGRSKDIIILRGRNYDPCLIEQAIDELAGVRSGCSAAFGIEDEQTGTEKLALLVEYRPQQVEGELPDLEQQIIEKIQLHCHLQISVLELLPPGTLPRTSSGKIRRQEAKRQWLQGELAPPAKASWGLLARENIRGLWHHLRGKHERSS